jgi:amino acid transporter
MSIVTDVPLSDPLSEVTRKERKFLLGVSVIGLFVSNSGIVPTKIAALGIELSSLDQKSFLTLLALVVAYFLTAFCIYGIADFLIWRKQYQKLLEQGAKEFLNWDVSDQQAYDEIHEHIPRADWIYTWTKPTAFIRMVFEFFVPIAFSAYAIVLVLISAYRI